MRDDASGEPSKPTENTHLSHHPLVLWRGYRIHFEEVIQPLEEICMVLDLGPNEDFEEIDEDDLIVEDINTTNSSESNERT